MTFEKVCNEIVVELKKSDVKSKREFNQIKYNVLQKYKLDKIPKNADIYFSASKEDREKFKDILSLKPVRTLSGVAPIALMSEPYPCPHTMKGIGPCTYCPGGPGSEFGDVPQSYTGKEPSTKRSIRNNYDPYLVVFNRLEHYVAMGKIPDKAEIIIQGGTFTFMPPAYQKYFVKYCFKAMNDFSKMFFGGGKLDMEKFKEFFEVPRQSEERDSRVREKIYALKNLKNGVKEEVKEKNKDPNVAAMLNVQLRLKKEDRHDISLEEVKKENEDSFIRCVGLTIETKSDFGKLFHGNLMLELGCTRVEIGVQSVYNEVLDATNRGNSVEDNIESIRNLKDLGFKINAHYMPGLPLTTKKMDEHGLRQLFDNVDYRPDMLKLYPCMVMPGTKLFKDWKDGKFKPIQTKEAAELIADFKKEIPTYCRVMRVQRDIPTNVTSDGVDKTNLRQYVEKFTKEKGIKCRCVRCREAGIYLREDGRSLNLDDGRLIVLSYEASKGKEYFISFEDLAKDVLFGFVRLRFPSEFLREEITENSALIREIHVFSSAVPIGERGDDSFQHKGIGKMLMRKAEEIAKAEGKGKMVVISGVGARNYFRKLSYSLEGVYMVKSL
tara:strand:+ start:5449 stop:7272 length:1824 start_codon:yes stop_codon:yes gene_type:complete